VLLKISVLLTRIVTETLLSAVAAIDIAEKSEGHDSEGIEVLSVAILF
jgi:hypothetical protein